MRRTGPVGGMVRLGGILLVALTATARAQQPYSIGALGFGPTGYGYAGYGYTVPGPRGMGYYTGIPEIENSGGPSAYYSPIFSAMNAAPGMNPGAKPLFGGPPPSKRLHDKLSAWLRQHDDARPAIPPERGSQW